MSDALLKPDPRVHAWRKDLAADYLRGEIDAPRYVKGQDFSLKTSAAALRDAPAHNAMMQTQILCGEVFRVYEKKGAWAWGQARLDDYVGYVPADTLAPLFEPSHYICALRSFVYADADIKSRPLMALSMGARVHICATQGRFSELKSGGFIISDDICTLDTIQSDYVTTAQKFIGTPYLWGGRESMGLDCSGLVQIALICAGFACPRDTDMQEAVLARMVDDPPRRGDLVFWRGHVGILTAPDRLLHANATYMRVVEEDFATACARIEKTDGAITAIKRLP